MFIPLISSCLYASSVLLFVHLFLGNSFVYPWFNSLMCSCMFFLYSLFEMHPKNQNCQITIFSVFFWSQFFIYNKVTFYCVNKSFFFFCYSYSCCCNDILQSDAINVFNFDLHFKVTSRVWVLFLYLIANVKIHSCITIM